MATPKGHPKKRGPTPKPDAEKRSVVLQVRLMPKELETLKEASQLKNEDVSTWLREVGLKAAQRALSKEA